MSSPRSRDRIHALAWCLALIPAVLVIGTVPIEETTLWSDPATGSRKRETWRLGRGTETVVWPSSLDAPGGPPRTWKKYATTRIGLISKSAAGGPPSAE